MSTHAGRRTRITIVLAGLLLLLLAVIGWMEFVRSSATSQAATSIKSIIIKRTGHADITLVRAGTDWNMTTPYKLVANPQRIDPLLSLGSATFQGYDKAEVDIPATGLNTPGASITIGTREFLLGKTDANGERRYALIDNKVSFVPDWVWSLVHGGVTAFSDLTVFGDLPDIVYLVKGNHVIEINNVAQWESLQADKISAWSSETMPQQQNQANETIWQLSTTQALNPTDPLATMLRLDDHTLINTQPGYAFAISNARLDALLDQ